MGNRGYSNSGGGGGQGNSVAARVMVGSYDSPNTVTAAGGITTLPGVDQDIYIIGVNTQSVTWSTVSTSPAAATLANIQTVAYAESTGTWCIAFSTDASTYYTATSTDRVTWTIGTALTISNAPRSIKWVPSISKWLMAGTQPTAAGFMRYSTDGLTWSSGTGISTGSNRTNFGVSFDWSPTLGRGVVNFSGSSGDQAYTSTDGIAWTASVTTLTRCCGLTWIGGSVNKFIIGSENATTGWYSTNGTSWTASTHAIITGSFPNCTPFAFDGTTIVGTGGSGTTRIETSTDGITWTSQTTANASHRSICYSSDIGIFVITGGTTTATGSYYSITGAAGTWTAVSTADTTNKSIAYGGGYFLIVGGATNLIEQGAVPATDITAVPQISAGTVDGQRLRLIGASSVFRVKVDNGNGVYRTSSWTSSANGQSFYAWDADQALWVSLL